MFKSNKIRFSRCKSFKGYFILRNGTFLIALMLTYCPRRLFWLLVHSPALPLLSHSLPLSSFSWSRFLMIPRT